MARENLQIPRFPEPAGDEPIDEQVNILIVDDLPEKLMIFEAVLEDLNQNLVSVRSGTEALREVLAREFAVILLDVNMPDIDGLETASLIRQYKKSAQTPIVFITAYVDELQARRGYALGAVDYIFKPFTPEILRSKVAIFVELFTKREALKRQTVAAQVDAGRGHQDAAEDEAEPGQNPPLDGQ